MTCPLDFWVTLFYLYICYKQNRRVPLDMLNYMFYILHVDYAYKYIF